MFNKIFLAAALSAASFSAHAAAFECKANINGVLVYGEGYVNVNHSGKGDWTFVCSLKNDYNGVSVATCATWAAMLQSAKKDGRKLDFYYYSNGSQVSCPTLSTYGSAVVPVYIGTI